MRTARWLPYGGVSLTETRPRQRPPSRDPPGQRPRPDGGQTNTCENITFANFVAGGNEMQSESVTFNVLLWEKVKKYNAEFNVTWIFNVLHFKVKDHLSLLRFSVSPVSRILRFDTVLAAGSSLSEHPSLCGLSISPTFDTHCMLRSRTVPYTLSTNKKFPTNKPPFTRKSQSTVILIIK